MAIQTIENLKSSFASGKIPTQKDYENLIDTLNQNTSTEQEVSKVIQVVPIGYHDWSNMQNYRVDNTAIFAGNYTPINIDNIIAYENDKLASVVVDSETESDGTSTNEFSKIIEGTSKVEILVIQNQSFYDNSDYNSIENPVPMYVTCNNNVVVAIPKGQAATFVRTINGTEFIRSTDYGESFDNNWYPTQSAITVTLAELEALRNA